MQISAKAVKWNKTTTDAVVFLVSKDKWKEELVDVDQALSKQLLKEANLDQFNAKLGTIFRFNRVGSPILLLGCGDASVDSLRAACGHLARFLANKHIFSVAIDTASISKLSAENLGKVITEGLLLGSYRFVKYQKADETHKKLEAVHILANAARLSAIASGISTGELFSKAQLFARDLINEPPSLTTPTFLANEAKKLAKTGILVEVLDRKDIEKLGMGAYLAVSRGSNEAPKYIKLTYKGNSKKIVIAGKAITFDTGGLSIKDAKNMETMKLDMAGAASVLGIFSVISQLKPKQTVIGLIAACENMPGATATKPGDIAKAVNGKTIEILNTDAEGRLTLADVLSLAAQEKPEAIIDLATLTGACMVALGEDIAGLFSNNEALAQKIKKAAQEEDEAVWRLPLPDMYREQIKSHIADLRNIAMTRYGGAITAALFLEEFVDKRPWVHLDIAGPAFAETLSPLTQKGGVGFGVRTLLRYLLSNTS